MEPFSLPATYLLSCSPNKKTHMSQQLLNVRTDAQPLSLSWQTHGYVGLSWLHARSPFVYIVLQAVLFSSVGNTFSFTWASPSQSTFLPHTTQSRQNLLPPPLPCLIPLSLQQQNPKRTQRWEGYICVAPRKVNFCFSFFPFLHVFFLLWVLWLYFICVPWLCFVFKIICVASFWFLIWHPVVCFILTCIMGCLLSPHVCCLFMCGEASELRSSLSGAVWSAGLRVER